MKKKDLKSMLKLTNQHNMAMEEKSLKNLNAGKLITCYFCEFASDKKDPVSIENKLWKIRMELYDEQKCSDGIWV